MEIIRNFNLKKHNNILNVYTVQLPTNFPIYLQNLSPSVEAMLYFRAEILNVQDFQENSELKLSCCYGVMRY